MWSLLAVVVVIAVLYAWLYVIDRRNMKEMKCVSEPVKAIIRDFHENSSQWSYKLITRGSTPYELISRKDGSVMIKVFSLPISVYPEIIALPPEHMNYKITVAQATQPISIEVVDAEALYNGLIRPIRHADTK